MSTQYPGGFIRATPTVPTLLGVTGIWTVDQALYYQSQGIWPVAKGAQAYTAAGTYTWVAPASVTSVSVVVVGSGRNATASIGGDAGALAYKNNIAVTPGASYTVFIGGTSSASTNYFSSTGLVSAGQATTRTGDGGGNGGTGTSSNGAGGGAGGYSGAGGNGNGSAGSGGGGGGGISFGTGGSGGGGVGLYGEGSSGAGGYVYASCCCTETTAAGGGRGSFFTGSGASSGGNNGTAYGPGSGSGGNYGGGGGVNGALGGTGAVRIVWPGNIRQFPSTNVGNI
jgi:hypothetical protein